MGTQLARGGTLIIGGGFAGASVARELGRRGCTIVTPEDELVYTPLLAEATGGELGLERVSVPVRTVCPHAEILRGHATALDSTRRVVAVRVTTGRRWRWATRLEIGRRGGRAGHGDIRHIW